MHSAGARMDFLSNLHEHVSRVMLICSEVLTMKRNIQAWEVSHLRGAFLQAHKLSRRSETTESRKAELLDPNEGWSLCFISHFPYLSHSHFLAGCQAEKRYHSCFALYSLNRTKVMETESLSHIRWANN